MCCPPWGDVIKQIAVKFESQYNIFHFKKIAENVIWKKLAILFRTKCAEQHPAGHPAKLCYQIAGLEAALTVEIAAIYSLILGTNIADAYTHRNHHFGLVWEQISVELKSKYTTKCRVTSSAEFGPA